MTGHSGVNQSNIEKLQPFYLKYVDISEQHNWKRSSEWQKEIDSLWRNEKTKIHPSLFNKKAKKETQTELQNPKNTHHLHSLNPL